MRIRGRYVRIWSFWTPGATAWMHAELLQSCPTFCDLMDYSLPGSSVHEVLQVRILEWVAMTSSRGSSQPRDQTHISCVSCIGQILYPLSHLGSPLGPLHSPNNQILFLASPLPPPPSTFTSENRDLISETAEPRRLWIGEHGHIRGQRMRCKGQK